MTKISDQFPPGTPVRFTQSVKNDRGVETTYESAGVVKSWENGPAGPEAHIRLTGGYFHDRPGYFPTYCWHAMGNGEMEKIVE